MTSLERRGRVRALAAVGAALVTIAVVLVLTACGERPQVINYEQGTYQGKPDTRPYEAAPFNGNKAVWENSMRTRTQNQNEYGRIR